MMTTKEMLEYIVKGPWITSGNDVQYKIDVFGDVAYITFQWTESKMDWKQNFKFWVKPYRDMPETWFVHKGFIENYKSVQDEITHKLISLKGIRNIVVLGYSHGAALATLCYEDLWYWYKDSYYICAHVFGSPRVVWMPSGVIKCRFSGDLCNYQVRGDIVTRVPFAVMGYRHVGDIVKLGKFKLFGWVKYHMIQWYMKYFG